MTIEISIKALSSDITIGRLQEFEDIFMEIPEQRFGKEVPDIFDSDNEFSAESLINNLNQQDRKGNMSAFSMKELGQNTLASPGILDSSPLFAQTHEKTLIPADNHNFMEAII